MSKTIKDFEDREYPNNRIKFIDLLSSDLLDESEHHIIHERLSTHPMLGPLYEAGLLHFSTEYRQSTSSSLAPKAPAKIQCSDAVALTKAINDSVSAIITDYAKCQPVAQHFLNISAQLLVESPAQRDSDEIDASFEGLSIEAVPCFEKSVRSDNYQYNTQQARICFQNFNPPLNAAVEQSTLLAHEFTHAIDDIYDKTQSIKILFDNLHRNAHNNTSKQEAILKCAAMLVDDSIDTLQREYLPVFTKGLHRESTNVEAWMRFAKNDRPFQHEDTGALECTSIPTEFLTFSTERFFDALKESTSAADFSIKYQQGLDKRMASARAHPYSLEILGAALELVSDTTSHHFNRIIEASQSTFPDLAQCCKNTQTALKERLDTSVAEGFKPNTTKSAFLEYTVTSASSIGSTAPRTKKGAKRISVHEQSHLVASMRTALEESGNDGYITIRPMIIPHETQLKPQQKKPGCIIL